MENKESCGLMEFEQLGDTSELQWYFYDMINDIMEIEGEDKSRYCLNGEQKGSVCLLKEQEGWRVIGRDKEWKSHDSFYHAICDFFQKVFGDNERAEQAIALFLTKTLDLPALMKEPSSFLLEKKMADCQREIERLEEKVMREPGKKEEALLSLNRIYLKGLKEKLENKKI